MPAAQEGAPYDRKAAAYDRLIPSRVYSKLLWAMASVTVKLGE